MKNKKIISLFLIFILLFSFFGCKNKNEEDEIKNREYDKTQVEEAARILLEKSVPVNEILFGRGFEFVNDNSNSIYKKASASSLEKYGVNKVEDIKALAGEVYSSGYMSTVNASDIFSSVSDGESIRFYTRYYNDEDGGIFVNSTYNYVLKNEYEYISDPVAIGSVGEFVIVKVTVRATILGENGESVKSRDFDHRIKMVEEDGEWKLHSSSYIVYNEYTDIYEDMNK